MSYSKISKRYAKAIFDFAQEQNTLGAIKADMEYIHQLCNVSADFVGMLKSPVIKNYKKLEIIDAILKKEVSDTTMKFLAIVFKGRREVIIPSLTEEFINMYNDFIGLRKVDMYSATKLSAGISAKIKSVLAQQTGKKIEINEHIQEDLIGGFVLKIDDLQYDASIKAKLSKLKHELSK